LSPLINPAHGPNPSTAPGPTRTAAQPRPPRGLAPLTDRAHWSAPSPTPTLSSLKHAPRLPLAGADGPTPPGRIFSPAEQPPRPSSRVSRWAFHPGHASPGSPGMLYKQRPHPVTLASIRSHPQTPDSPPRSQSRNRRTALARSTPPSRFHRRKSLRLLASDPGATSATSSALYAAPHPGISLGAAATGNTAAAPIPRRRQSPSLPDPWNITADQH
jgi:hypothetical protein